MTKHKIIFIGLLSIIIILIATFLISPYSTAIFKSKSHFIQYSSSTNVYYEQGAEDFADSIALYLPKAVKRVEQIHRLPFEESFKIYICNTQKSFNEFIANTSPFPIRGAAMLGNVLIAPSAFNFIGRDTHKETLTHELSHLHFRQRIGFFKGRKHPAWFREGLADYVAGSGGEGIEDSEAINLILNGKHFIPEEEGEIFGSLHKAFNGLSGRMFHKQVKMFVAFLYHYNDKSFQNFLLDIQNDKSFKESIKNRFGYDVTELWKKFFQQL